MKEVTFINVSLRYPTELYDVEELPDMASISVWMEKLAKRSLVKWGLSYNPERKSYIASYTNKGGKPAEPDPVITAFGGTMLSAYQKLYVVVEVLGFDEYGEAFMRERLENAEVSISEELMRVLRK